MMATTTFGVERWAAGAAPVAAARMLGADALEDALGSADVTTAVSSFRGFPSQLAAPDASNMEKRSERGLHGVIRRAPNPVRERSSTKNHRITARPRRSSRHTNVTLLLAYQ